MSVGKLVTESVDENSALLRGSDIYFFPDCFPVGMAEGVLEACGVQGTVALRTVAPTEIELFVRWA